MLERTSSKRPRPAKQRAVLPPLGTADETDERQSAPAKNPHAAALGKLGGKKGGPARAMKLSADERRDIARKAAQARWRGGRDAQGGM